MSLITLFITSAITNNIILAKFIGLCPFFGTTDNTKKALSMSLTVMIVMFISSILNFFVYNFILEPFDIMYMKTIIFILIISGIVGSINIIIKHTNTKLYDSLGIYLPLVATNCAVLAVSIISVSLAYTFIEMLVFVLGTSLGYMFVLYTFSIIKIKLENSSVPKCFKGYPISFIIAGIMAMIFSLLKF